MTDQLLKARAERFCKPKVGGSSPSAGTIENPCAARESGRKSAMTNTPEKWEQATNVAKESRSNPRNSPGGCSPDVHGGIETLYRSQTQVGPVAVTFTVGRVR